MARKLIGLTALALSVTAVTASAPSAAQSYRDWDGYSHSYYDGQAYDQPAFNRAGYDPYYGRDYHSRRPYAGDRVYRGSGHYYRYRCDGGNGAVGTIAGGAGGALIGNAVGGGALGTVLGGLGGALLGRHLDKQHTKEANGC